MIVGCYSMDLYCMHEGLPLHYDQWGPIVPAGHHFAGEFPHKFDGDTESACKQQARQRGWLFRNGEAICPRCSPTPPPAVPSTKIGD